MADQLREAAGRLLADAKQQTVARNLFTVWKKDLDVLRDALAASPGEPEEQRFKAARQCDLDCSACGAAAGERCKRKGVFNRPLPCGRDAELDRKPRSGLPDHGPGEPSDPRICTYCGESFPVPVELHHAEADCAGLKDRASEGEINER